MNRAEQEQPQLLKDNWQKWTVAYLENLKRNPAHKLNIQNSKQKKKAYKDTIDALLIITKQHCAFCDNWPLGNRNIEPTIEHFKPKAKDKFPELAYSWDNLFPCCSYCQKKGDNFNEKLLKPDVEGYYFFDYFEFDMSVWEIKPSERQNISAIDKERATITIEIYKLNGYEEDKGNRLRDVRVERQRIMNNYRLTSNPEIDDFPFRFMFY